MSVAGKVVAITGAARGMGRAYVEGFLDQGAKVVALDRSWVPTGMSGDRNDEFARSLQNRDDAITLTCDITDDEQIEDAYEQTIKKFGRVDILLNNASLRQIDLFKPTGVATIMETNHEDFLKMFDVSFFGTLKITRVFLQDMLGRGSGHIITVGSNGGATKEDPDGTSTTLRSPRFEQPYQSAKSALSCLMGYLAYELEPKGIAVNVIYPASAHTTGYEERAVARAEQQGKSAAEAHIHGGARPEHVVPLALWLADQEGASLTGHFYETLKWNAANGHGDAAFWADK